MIVLVARLEGVGYLAFVERSLLAQDFQCTCDLCVHLLEQQRLVMLEVLRKAGKASGVLEPLWCPCLRFVVEQFGRRSTQNQVEIPRQRVLYDLLLVYRLQANCFARPQLHSIR